MLRRLCQLLFWLCATVWGGAACSGHDAPQMRGAAGSEGVPGLILDKSNLVIHDTALCSPNCLDLPRDPLFDMTPGSAPPPADAAKWFGDANDFDAKAGPCVVEPQLSNGDVAGSLFPNNWLRPRFRWVPAGNEDVWQIRISVPNQKYALVAYTTRTVWALPKDIWQGLARSSADTTITVTVRGVSSRAPKKPSGTRGDFAIAPAEARGKLVYWAATSSEVRPETSKLAGFDVGDESVIDALTVPGVNEGGILNAGGRELRGKYDDPKGVPAGHVQCIGCHVSTPDGGAVAFTDHWPWNSVLASVEEASVGKLPSYVTPGAALLLNQPWLGMQTFSKAHFSAGDRLLVTVYSPRNADRGGVGFADGAPYPSHHDGLAWFDLETTATFLPGDSSRGDAQQQLNDQVRAQAGQAFGLLSLTGETRSAAAPHFSHDGKRIVYTSADTTQDGRLSSNNQEVDLHIVPFADRLGGAVTPLKGAAEPGVAEYYPNFSADDSLVAFNRVAKIDGGAMYYRPDGEVFVIASDGGKPVRLAANDPPACTAQKSPGVINSWPKWSPAAFSVMSSNPEFGPPPRTFYWLVFSSARAYDGQFQLPKSQSSPSDTRSSQLYVTAVIRDLTNGNLLTYPAIYLWNQDPKTSNLTPAWDEFKIPPVPTPD